MIEKSVVLFRCRKKLNSKLKERVIDSAQKIYVTRGIDELEKIINDKKYLIVVYDKKDRNAFIEIIKKIRNNKKFYSVIIMTNNEARKFNFKKHQSDEFIYISKPARLEELSQFLNLLFKIEFLNENLIDLEKIIQAFEQAGEFSRKELMEAYESLKAHEIVSELSRKELMETQESLTAWERVAEFTRKERMETTHEFEALNQVLELSRQERILADKIINAWERTMELAREELLEAYNKLKDVLNEKKELLEKLIDKIPQSKKRSHPTKS